MYDSKHIGYLTNALLASPTNINRNQTVGGIQQSRLATNLTFPYNDLVVRSMISGLQLTNSVGNNNYVKVTPFFHVNTTNITNSSFINYYVEV